VAWAARRWGVGRAGGWGCPAGRAPGGPGGPSSRWRGALSRHASMPPCAPQRAVSAAHLGAVRSVHRHIRDAQHACRARQDNGTASWPPGEDPGADGAARGPTRCLPSQQARTGAGCRHQQGSRHGAGCRQQQGSGHGAGCRQQQGSGHGAGCRQQQGSGAAPSALIRALTSLASMLALAKTKLSAMSALPAIRHMAGYCRAGGGGGGGGGGRQAWMTGQLGAAPALRKGRQLVGSWSTSSSTSQAHPPPTCRRCTRGRSNPRPVAARKPAAPWRLRSRRRPPAPPTTPPAFRTCVRQAGCRCRCRWAAIQLVEAVITRLLPLQGCLAVAPPAGIREGCLAVAPAAGTREGCLAVAPAAGTREGMPGGRCADSRLTTPAAAQRQCRLLCIRAGAVDEQLCDCPAPVCAGAATGCVWRPWRRAAASCIDEHARAR
jgi:hypothetical protein